MAELLSFLRFDVEVGAIRRRMVPITGGMVSGAHNGIILPDNLSLNELQPDAVRG